MSSIGAVKAALVTILGAALPGSQVIPGPVDVTTLGTRVVVVGSGITPLLFSTSSLDGSSGTESYALTLLISVASPASALSGAETAALDDFAAAMVAIRADPSLGIGNLNAEVNGSGELVETADINVRAAQVRFPVEIFTTF